MQRGYIYRHRNCWYLRFYEDTLENGERGRKQSCRKLAPISDEYPTKRSVLLLADKILAPINSKSLQPESAVPVVDFIEHHYLPHVQRDLRPSTYKDYKKDVFERHLKKRLGDLRLRDFRTVHGQKIISSIQSPEVGHKTLMRIKSFLSGTFKHAKRLGFIDGENPMRDVAVPGRPAKFKGEVYTLDEIESMLIALPEPARTVVAVAALTGLRHSEIRGLKWSDFDGQFLTISRSVWRTHVGPTKTEASEGVVPVLPMLQKVLEIRREKLRGKDEEYIFAGKRRGAPLNLANLANRVIKPCFKKRKPEIQWKGWHAFRRALASNLYSLGVEPKVIQAILRQADIGTTLAYYIQTPDEKSREAIEQIESAVYWGLA
jgi:integrase